MDTEALICVTQFKQIWFFCIVGLKYMVVVNEMQIIFIILKYQAQHVHITTLFDPIVAFVTIPNLLIVDMCLHASLTNRVIFHIVSH